MLREQLACGRIDHGMRSEAVDHIAQVRSLGIEASQAEGSKNPAQSLFAPNAKPDAL
jgi:hypothetical protein